MSDVSKLVHRFTQCIEHIKNQQLSYIKMPLYTQIIDNIGNSITNTSYLHQVRDSIKEIQKKLDSENIFFLNFQLMMLFSSLAYQHQSKEFLYFSALCCNNVMSMYYCMYQHEITSIDVKDKCDEMMLLLLSQVAGIEVLTSAREIAINKTAK